MESTKSDIVLLLFQKATDRKTSNPGIIGKKALHKSLYFFNESFNLFDYKWRDYGPFSEEIQQMAFDFMSTKRINTVQIPTKKSGIFITKMTFNHERNPDFADIEFTGEINAKMDEIVGFIDGRTPRDLELLASVHYWAIRQHAISGKYTVQYIHDALVKLKPDAGFTPDNVKYAIDELKSHKYLPA